MAARQLMVAALVLVVTVSSAQRVLADEDQDATPEERLRKKLLKDYDNSSLPQRDSNGTTVVEMTVQVQGAWIEEDKQVINLNAWILMTWMDPRLTWDHKDYGGLNEVHLGDHELWQPGIVLYNNADATQVDQYGSVDVIVKSDGRVWWVPPATFRAECPLDSTYWPYDIQHCFLYLGSWTRHGLHIDIQLYGNRSEIRTGWFIKYTHSWQYRKGQLQRIQLDYSALSVHYVMLEMYVAFERVSPIFTSTIVLPAVVISMLTLLQFLLPLQEPRRLMLGCVSLILTLMMLIYLATTVPTLAQSVPIIVKFFGQTLVVVMVSVGVNGVLLRLTDPHHPAYASAPPLALKTLLTGPFATVFFLKQYTEKVGLSGGGAEDAEVLEDSQPASRRDEWLLVAAFVDRLAAIAFVTTFIITLITHVASV